jgi:hypothetical protein
MAKGQLTVSDGRKTVTTAGTRVALATTSAVFDSVAVTAETDNTGIITIGGSTVVAALATRQGTPLSAGDTVVLENVDLAKVYIDSTVNTDGVTWAGTPT